MESQKCYNTRNDRSTLRGSHNPMLTRRDRGVMLQRDLFPIEHDLFRSAERLRTIIFRNNQALQGYWELLSAADRACVMLELRETVLASYFGEVAPDRKPAVWLYSRLRDRS